MPAKTHVLINIMICQSPKTNLKSVPRFAEGGLKAVTSPNNPDNSSDYKCDSQEIRFDFNTCFQNKSPAFSARVKLTLTINTV
jgi:hypothetical protein